MKIQPVMELIEKARRQRVLLLGAEVERLGQDAEGRILQYSSHISGLLADLVQNKAWKASSYDSEGRILSLERDKDFITLEPGAQLEISPAPSKNLFDLCHRERDLSEELLSTETAKDWKWIWWGVNPKMKAEEVELIPSARYALMSKYFPQVGSRGLEMMRLTTGSHLNLDFFEAQEAIEMIQASCFLAPIVGAIFAHSPFYQGQRTPFLSVRHQIWRGTDGIRSGLPKAFFNPDFQLKDYVNLVESTPLMYFEDEAGSYQAAQNRALKDLSVALQKRNALNAMRQLFYDVRIKPCCLEFRALDQQLPPLRLSAFAFLVGILYDPENRQVAAKLALEWGAEKVWKAQDEASKSGLLEDELYTWAKKLFERAERALVARGFGEEVLLEKMQILLQKRKSAAEYELEEASA